MPIPEGAVQALQQQKPRTYEALSRFINALAALPQADDVVATTVNALADQLGQATQPTESRVPSAPNNMTGRPFNAQAARAQMRPASERAAGMMPT